MKIDNIYFSGKAVFKMFPYDNYSAGDPNSLSSLENKVAGAIVAPRDMVEIDYEGIECDESTIVSLPIFGFMLRF